MKSLLPCPHCGADRATFVGRWDGNGETIAVACTACPAASPHRPSRTEAAEIWNRRPVPDEARGCVVQPDACRACGSTGAHYCTGKPRSKLNEQIREVFMVGQQCGKTSFLEQLQKMEQGTGPVFRQEYLGRWEGPEMFERVRRD